MITELLYLRPLCRSLQSRGWLRVVSAYQCCTELPSPLLNHIFIFIFPCVLQLRVKGIPAVFPELFAITKIRGMRENCFMAPNDS